MKSLKISEQKQIEQCFPSVEDVPDSRTEESVFHWLGYNEEGEIYGFRYKGLGKDYIDAIKTSEGWNLMISFNDSKMRVPSSIPVNCCYPKLSNVLKSMKVLTHIYLNTYILVG